MSITLPSGYVALPYIEATGGQRIDTGIRPVSTETFRIVLNMSLDARTSGAWLFGAGVGGNAQLAAQALSCCAIQSRSGAEVIQKQLFDNNNAESHALYNRFTYDRNGMTTSVTMASGARVSFSHTEAPTAVDQNIVLFDAYGYGSSTFTNAPVAAKLYGCQMYLDGELVRNFVPCVSPEQRVGLYDTVGGAFYGNVGYGKFLSGARPYIGDENFKLRGLPAGYEQRMFVRSYGKQYIDTGVKPCDGTVVEMDVRVNDANTNGLWLFGCREPDSTGAVRFIYGMKLGIVNRNTGERIFYFYDNRNRESRFPRGVSLLRRGTLLFNKNGELRYNSVANPLNYRYVWQTSLTTESNVPLYLLDANIAAYNAKDPAEGSKPSGSGVKADLYGCKIYNEKTGELQRDYVPCVDPDGLVGVFDMVSMEFTALGNKELPDGYTRMEYIESDGSQYFDTNLSGNNGYTIEVDAELTAAASSDWLFGAAYGSNYYGVCLNGETGVTAWNYSKTAATATDTLLQRAMYERTASSLTVTRASDGKEICKVGTGTVTRNPSSTWHLFNIGLYSGGKEHTNMANAVKAKVYGCRVYTATKEIKNFVPCASPEGMLGFYDTVGGVFYGNGSGTGVFKGKVLQENAFAGTTHKEDVAWAVEHAAVARYKDLQGRGSFVRVSTIHVGDEDGKAALCFVEGVSK